MTPGGHSHTLVRMFMSLICAKHPVVRENAVVLIVFVISVIFQFNVCFTTAGWLAGPLSGGDRISLRVRKMLLLCLRSHISPLAGLAQVWGMYPRM